MTAPLFLGERGEPEEMEDQRGDLTLAVDIGFLCRLLSSEHSNG